MKILFMEWNSVGKADLKDAFTKEGHTLVVPSCSIAGKTYRELPEMERQWSLLLQNEKPDIVFSVNYYPAVSNFCNKNAIRYISWIYDSPYGRLYSETVPNPCNRIYVFDKELYLECRDSGITTVRYMPLAANTERLDRLTADVQAYAYDVSFVGSLYVEKDVPFIKMSQALSGYAKGYLDALVASQMKIQGYNFIQEVLDPVMEEMCKAYPMVREPGGKESKEYYYAQYVINEWITAVERIDLLDAAAGRYGVDLFTQYQGFSLSGLQNHGLVDYDSGMPLVFKQSKVNLNITRRGIHKGIPLRAIDIMGAGGFLLSNFQSDFLDFFVPGEDFVYYESKEDLLQKIGYYLEHEKEREAIAKRGHDKVAAGHTYRHRVREMLKSV